MMQSRKAQALWTLSSALLISACEPEHIVKALPIPPDRIDCQAATGKRPQLPPEYRVDWSKISTVGQAKTEFDNFTMVLRGREKTVSTYVLDIEGQLFQCASDAQWIREYLAPLTK